MMKLLDEDDMAYAFAQAKLTYRYITCWGGRGRLYVRCVNPFHRRDWKYYVEAVKVWVLEVEDRYGDE